MARLIDANALLETITKTVAENPTAPENVGKIIIAITEAPTVDAVEVVRCKDCKRFEVCFPTPYIKKIHEHAFCSYGERKDNGN